MYQKWTNILHGFTFANVKKYYIKAKHRGGSKNSAASKMEVFFDKRSRIKVVNYCQQQTFALMKTSFVFVFRRRLDQDEYVRLSLTSSRRLGQDQYIRLGHMSSRRL